MYFKLKTKTNLQKFPPPSSATIYCMRTCNAERQKRFQFERRRQCFVPLWHVTCVLFVYFTQCIHSPHWFSHIYVFSNYCRVKLAGLCESQLIAATTRHYSSPNSCNVNQTHFSYSAQPLYLPFLNNIQ